VKNFASSDKGSVRIRVLTAVLMKIHKFCEMTLYLLVRICISAQRNISEDLSFQRGTCFRPTDTTDVLYLTANV